MSYPSLTSPYDRRRAAHELRRTRQTLAYCREETHKLDPGASDFSTRARVYAQMRSETYTKLQAMRTILHNLFD